MVSYLATMRFAQIRVLTGEPDNSDLKNEEYNWTKAVYGDIKEKVPEGIPDPLGNYVTLSLYYDANLYHHVVTGWSVTGILHFMNKMPIDWYSKKQATVETASYSSKFIVHTLVSIGLLTSGLPYTSYLNVPIHDVSYIFGDNMTIVQSATHHHAKLHKHHNALSFHCVQEVIMSKHIIMTHMPGMDTPVTF
jgi:hypothetical protein